MQIVRIEHSGEIYEQYACPVCGKSNLKIVPDKKHLSSELPKTVDTDDEKPKIDLGSAMDEARSRGKSIEIGVYKVEDCNHLRAIGFSGCLDKPEFDKSKIWMDHYQALCVSLGLDLKAGETLGGKICGEDNEEGAALLFDFMKKELDDSYVLFDYYPPISTNVGESDEEHDELGEQHIRTCIIYNFKSGVE